MVGHYLANQKSWLENSEQGKTIRLEKKGSGKKKTAIRRAPNQL